MKEIFIHVGYPKTSTTWIQECFFSEHPELHYLGTTLKKPANKDISTPRVWWLSKLANLHSHDFDADYFRDEAEKTMRTDTLNCISYEGFVGDPFNNWFNSEIRAQRLAKVFPKAKILITLRDQLSMMASMYGEYLKAGGTYPIDKLIDWDEGQLGRHEAFVLAQLKYDKTVQMYKGLFGSDNVLVLFYEDFLWDRIVYLERICQFAEIGSFIPDSALYRGLNVGFRNYRILQLLRHANKHFKSNLHPYNILPRRGLYRVLKMFDFVLCKLAKQNKDTKEYLLRDIKDRLHAYYRDSNDALEQLTHKSISSCEKRNGSITK